MVNISNVQNESRTLAVVDGTVKEVYLEALVINALYNVFDSGSLGEIGNTQLMLPVYVDGPYSNESILHNFKGDKVLVSFDAKTNNYLFGPVNENTCHLVIDELKKGFPIFKTVLLKDLGIFDEGFMYNIHQMRLRLGFNNRGEDFICEHVQKNGSSTVTHCRNLSDMLEVMNDNKYEALKHLKIYTISHNKPMGLDTGIKKLGEMDNSEVVFALVAEGSDIKTLDEDSVTNVVFDKPNDLGLFLYEARKELRNSDDKKAKLYLYSILSLHGSLTDFISKEYLRDVKSLFSELSKRVNNSRNALSHQSKPKEVM